MIQYFAFMQTECAPIKIVFGSLGEIFVLYKGRLYTLITRNILEISNSPKYARFIARDKYMEILHDSKIKGQ